MLCACVCLLSLSNKSEPELSPTCLSSMFIGTMSISCLFMTLMSSMRAPLPNPGPEAEQKAFWCTVMLGYLDAFSHPEERLKNNFALTVSGTFACFLLSFISLKMDFNNSRYNRHGDANSYPTGSNNKVIPMKLTMVKTIFSHLVNLFKLTMSHPLLSANQQQIKFNGHEFVTICDLCDPLYHPVPAHDCVFKVEGSYVRIYRQNRISLFPSCEIGASHLSADLCEFWSV